MYLYSSLCAKLKGMARNLMLIYTCIAVLSCEQLSMLSLQARSSSGTVYMLSVEELPGPNVSVLRCSRSPQPIDGSVIVHWFKGSESLAANARISFSEPGDSHLVIHDPMSSDDALYKCCITLSSISRVCSRKYRLIGMY